jgi:tetratricopeptide (TPR) repeat protein
VTQALGYANAAMTQMRNVAEQVKQVADEVELVKHVADEVEQVKQVVDEKDRNNAVALDLCQQQLSGTEVKVADLAHAFKAASRATLVEVYTSADRQRRRTWIHGLHPDNALVIPVFEALLQCDSENKWYQAHGSLAFALKNLRRYPEAIDELTTAITLRGPDNGLVIYEYVRAVCRIRR